MELLNVDYITFNLTKLFESDIEELETYFQNLGFNFYQKQLDSNQFEVYFILKIPYQKEIIQLQFIEISRKQFYKLIEQRTVQWKKFPNPVFSKLDLVYKRISKFNDPISTIDFINSCYIQFQELHSPKNLSL